MRFNFEGRNYAIRWQYDSTENPPFHLDEQGKRVPNKAPFHRNTTKCILSEIEEVTDGQERKINVLNSWEMSVSRKYDEINDREYARKESLKKVLDIRGKLNNPSVDPTVFADMSKEDKYNYLNPHLFSREFRTQAWNTYHSRKTKKEEV